LRWKVQKQTSNFGRPKDIALCNIPSSIALDINPLSSPLLFSTRMIKNKIKNKRERERG
jgi:hypothetical protein